MSLSLSLTLEYLSTHSDYLSTCILTYIAELNTQLYSSSSPEFHMCHTLPLVKACPHALNKKDRGKEKMDRMKYREWDRGKEKMDRMKYREWDSNP